MAQDNNKRKHKHTYLYLLIWQRRYWYFLLVSTFSSFQTFSSLFRILVQAQGLTWLLFLTTNRHSTCILLLCVRCLCTSMLSSEPCDLHMLVPVNLYASLERTIFIAESISWKAWKEGGRHGIIYAFSVTSDYESIRKLFAAKIQNNATRIWYN